MPTDRTNLVFKGADAFVNAYDQSRLPDAVIVDVDKRLPVAAGIAGGSGNAAAVMLGLNALTDYPFTLRELMSIGAAVGADVPFSIFMNAYRNKEALADLPGIEEACDSAWTCGIGEIIEAADPVTRAVILANPGTGVSTKSAYEAMDSIGYSDKDSSERRLFVNDMESYTLNEKAEAAVLKQMMLDRLNADEVLMSGSGPTMVAYYTDGNEAAKDAELLRKLTGSDKTVRIWLSDTGRNSQGERQ